MFIPHDLGEHLHCYGHQSVRSPNLNQLASDGVRFTNCFATAPECTPSRAGLYTGLYTHQTGLMGLCHRGWEFNPEVQHLAQRLRDGGYQTYVFGVQHETAVSLTRLGYNHVFTEASLRPTPVVCNQVESFLRKDAVHAEQPWFACVGFRDTHRPWREDGSFLPEEVDVPPYLPDHPEVRADLAHMHQAIEDMDTGIGRVLNALKSSSLAENTLVLYTADHGIPFPRAKSTFYDPGIRNALIMSWPGHLPRGRAYDQLISNLDISPTLQNACGIDVPSGLEGRSFLSLLKGRCYEERDAVFGALYYDAFYDPMHMVRTRQYKYIRSFAVTEKDAEGADPETLAKHETGTWIRADDSDVQDSPTWQYMKRQGPFPPPQPEELYNLESDPFEQNNVADDSRYAHVLEEMRTRLQEMMERTNSPLLKGHVSPELSSTRNRSRGA